MHCQRFLGPSLSRRDMLLRCANGFGALAAAALLHDPAYGAILSESEPRRHCARETIRFRPGPRNSPPRRGASSSCSWTAGRRSSIRSTPSPGSIASTAVRSRSRLTRLSSTTSATCSMPLEVSPLWPERHPRQRLVPEDRSVCGPARHREIDGLEFLGAHDRQLLHAHRQRPARPAQPRRMGHLRPWQRCRRICPASWS